MKVLLTGCVGFIGSNLAAHLLNAGYSVLGFDNMVNPSLGPTDRIKAATGRNWEKFRFYKVDIRDLETMRTICAVERPDFVVHLAALGSIPRSFASAPETIVVNEVGFANVLQLCSELGVRRLVFASSSNVYGSNQKPIKVEGQEGAPMNPYGLSKLQNEIMARIWRNQFGLEYIGLRFFNVYGPGQNPFSPYAAVIPRFFMDEKVVIYGDGEQTRDFTFVEDVAIAIEKALTSKGFGLCLNVGSGRSTSINELAKLIAPDKPIQYKPARPGEQRQSQASVDRLIEVLGYSPNTSLSDGLEKTRGFYECQKKEYQDDHFKRGSQAMQGEAPKSQD